MTLLVPLGEAITHANDMNWLVSLVIALLTGALGLFVAGGIAALCVSWYRISGFEGGSGYFTVAIAIMGGCTGFFIGLIASRFFSAAQGAWAF